MYFRFTISPTFGEPVSFVSLPQERSHSLPLLSFTLNVLVASSHAVTVPLRCSLAPLPAGFVCAANADAPTASAATIASARAFRTSTFMSIPLLEMCRLSTGGIDDKTVAHGSNDSPNSNQTRSMSVPAVPCAGGHPSRRDGHRQRAGK